MRSVTPSGCQGRRRDLHPHDPVYKTGAFLNQPRRQSFKQRREEATEHACPKAGERRAEERLPPSAFILPHRSAASVATPYGSFGGCLLSQEHAVV